MYVQCSCGNSLAKSEWYMVKMGPATKEEENRVRAYLILMNDMGYGLTREMVMNMLSLINHPFTILV